MPETLNDEAVVKYDQDLGTDFIQGGLGGLIFTQTHTQKKGDKKEI